MKKSNTVYFQGIDALRFFAAMLVVIHHSETIKPKYGFEALTFSSFFNLGSQAVSFFFVLSGFLITYLLLVEQEKNQKINIPNFYLRRVLRIWPLYFLLVFLGVYFIPWVLQLINFDYQMPYSPSMVVGYFAGFMPFVVNIKYGHHLLEPLWSIGVEEVFYLIWAPLCVLFHRHITKTIAVFLLLKIGLNTLAITSFDNHFWKEIILTLKFEEMAIGALCACMIKLNKKALLGYIYSKPVQISAWCLLASRCLFHKQLMEFSPYQLIFDNALYSSLIVAVLFATVILNVACNPKSFVKLRNKKLNKLGEFSYGIYMYHMLIVFATVLVFKLLTPSLNNMVFQVVYYTLVVTIVIWVSAGSKKYFEDPFLRLKRYFTSY